MNNLFIYKGFIKVDTLNFYPISRIKSISHCFGSVTKTNIIFDDNKELLVDQGLLKVIDSIKGE